LYETDITIQGTRIRIGNLDNPKIAPWGHIVMSNGPHAGNEHIEYNEVELQMDHIARAKLLGILMRNRMKDQEHWKKQTIYDELNRIENIIHFKYNNHEDLTKEWLKHPLDIIYIIEKTGSWKEEIEQGFLKLLFPNKRTAEHRDAVQKWQDKNCSTCRYPDQQPDIPGGVFCPKIYSHKPSREELKKGLCKEKNNVKKGK